MAAAYHRDSTKTWLVIAQVLQPAQVAATASRSLAILGFAAYSASIYHKKGDGLAIYVEARPDRDALRQFVEA